jgi:hypothetical protein
MSARGAPPGILLLSDARPKNALMVLAVAPRRDGVAGVG